MVRQVPEVAAEPGIAAALEALRDGWPEQAESICRERLEHNPGSIDHLRLVGRALMMQSRHAEAEDTVRRAIALRPDFAPLHEDLGAILSMQKRFEEAVASFRTALELDPNLTLAHKKLGQALAALGRGAEADAAIETWFGQDAGRAEGRCDYYATQGAAREPEQRGCAPQPRSDLPALERITGFANLPAGACSVRLAAR